MARAGRLKVRGESAYYHVISYVVGNQFLLGDLEKEQLFDLICRFSSFYFVKVLGFSIMSNHFHLLVKMESSSCYDDAEVLRRLVDFYGSDDVEGYDLAEVRDRLSDLSQYVGDIKQRFSLWYNRGHNRRGYFWGDRFKSVLLERGEALLSCLGYIDLNSVRAGLVRRPESYRWSGIGYWVQGGNRSGLLSVEEIFGEEALDWLSVYRKFLYHAGGIEKVSAGGIGADVLKIEELRGFKLPRRELLRYRWRYFSDGLVLGSKAFIGWAYGQFGGRQVLKSDRSAHGTGLGAGLYSLKRLNSH